MTEQEKKEFWENYKRDFAAGSISGAISQIVLHPLDTSIIKDQAGTSGKNYKNLGHKILGETKTVSKKVGKGTLGAGVGYPTFMAAQKYLTDKDKDKEKKASLLPITTTPNAAKILPKFYHSANPGEFGRSRSMKTSEAIDYLTKSWTHRPINIGKGKEYYGPTKVAAAGLLNIGVKAFKGLKNLPKSMGNNMPGFIKGLTFTGMKGTSAKVGIGTGLTAPMLAPPIKNTLLEEGTKNTTRRLRSNMLSPKNV